MTMCSGGRGAVEQEAHGRQEIVGDGAADAAVAELDHVLLGASFEAAAEKDLAVDAEVAELVDDEGEAAAARPADQMADQAGLAGAQEAGDHRRRYLFHCWHGGQILWGRRGRGRSARRSRG